MRLPQGHSSEELCFNCLTCSLYLAPQILGATPLSGDSCCIVKSIYQKEEEEHHKVYVYVIHVQVVCRVANWLLKNVLCHCAEVAMISGCCNHRLCFLQCDCKLENSFQKATNIKETWEIGRSHPTFSQVRSAHETKIRYVIPKPPSKEELGNIVQWFCTCEKIGRWSGWLIWQLSN